MANWYDHGDEPFTKYLQLNTSNNNVMLYHQLNQQNASIDSANQQLNERLNTSIDMLYQQLNQQDQQLRQEYTALDNRTQQLNTSTQLLLNGLEGLLDSIHFTLQTPVLLCLPPPPQATIGSGPPMALP